MTCAHFISTLQQIGNSVFRRNHHIQNVFPLKCTEIDVRVLEGARGASPLHQAASLHFGVIAVADHAICLLKKGGHQPTYTILDFSLSLPCLPTWQDVVTRRLEKKVLIQKVLLAVFSSDRACNLPLPWWKDQILFASGIIIEPLVLRTGDGMKKTTNESKT